MTEALRPTASNTLDQSCRIVASHFNGERGEWCYSAFDWINETLFAGGLPIPLILIMITPHGKCLGSTRSRSEGPPIIKLHPTLWGIRERARPWGIDPSQLTPRFALDVLIHECIHVSVEYCLGGADGESSHNNPQWIGEVNRIAPLIGLEGVQAAQSKPKRQGGRVQRVSDGTVPYKAVTTFPQGVREVRGEAGAYYRCRDPLPFERDVQLDVTGGPRVIDHAELIRGRM